MTIGFDDYGAALRAYARVDNDEMDCASREKSTALRELIGSGEQGKVWNLMRYVNKRDLWAKAKDDTFHSGDVMICRAEVSS